MRVMRILIDLPDADRDQLKDLAVRRRTSRAALVREAVGEFLARQRRATLRDSFGLLTDGEDGLAYQQRLRDEW